MRTTLIVFLLFLAELFSTLSKYIKNASGKEKVQEVVHGPFTIRLTTFSGRHFNSNYGWVKGTTVALSVWRRGKEIGLPGPLQGNSGYRHLWKVYLLQDAPVPTLIAGSQGLYLIREEAGEARVTLLHGQSHDFASLQFLDENDGQPGPYREVYMASGSSDGVEVLTGGRLLLVNKALLLNVADLTTRAVPSADGEYHGYSCAPGAFVISPDKKAIVFWASKLSEDVVNADALPGNFTAPQQDLRYDHALVVVNPYSGEVYPVAYDLARTHMPGPGHETPHLSLHWFATYFEWKREASGRYRLQLRREEGSH
jgi:hypothetical protein